jgi:hypothetical protein
MGANQTSRPWSWRLRVAAIGSLFTVVALASPASALAATRERVEYDVIQNGTVVCDGFVDNFTDFYHVRETDIYDSEGTLVRVTYHIEHHSIDTNSVTGFSIYEHGHFLEVDDFVAGTYTVTGVQQLANRQGTGVVVQDTGRLVFDSDFNIVFFAGGRNHSNAVQGEQIYCDALS